MSRLEYVAKDLPLLVREQVAVTPSLRLGTMTDEFVDKPLIDAFGCEVRDEGMT